MFVPIGGASIETFSTPPPRNSCRCCKKNRLFDTNILEMHLIQAELWQTLCSSSPKFVTMATKV